MADFQPVFDLVVDRELSFPHGRWVTLKLAGVSVISELVYDTDPDGNRTDEQAVKNFSSLLASRLQKVLNPYD